MFSRSDKSEESNEDVSFESEPSQRSPMVLAAVAGLLAIAGAFLLVRYLSNTNETAAADAEAEVKRNVLVLTQDLPDGTRVDDILIAPTSYLQIRAVPEAFIARDAVTSIPELEELSGRVLDGAALEGEQLLRVRFDDPSDFTGDGLIERATDLDIPAGHHTVVVALPSRQALGGNISGGEKVAVISSFRHDPPERDPFEVSVVVLPAVEVIAVQTTAEIVGQIAQDDIGTATVGDVFVTLAVEPSELTDLTFAMKYGDIILAGALESSSDADPRPLTTLQAIIDRSTFIDDEGALELLEALTANDEGLAALEAEDDGEDDNDEGDGDSGDGGTDGASDEADTSETSDGASNDGAEAPSNDGGAGDEAPADDGDTDESGSAGDAGDANFDPPPARNAGDNVDPGPAGDDPGGPPPAPEGTEGNNGALPGN